MNSLFFMSGHVIPPFGSTSISVRCITAWVYLLRSWTEDMRHGEAVVAFPRMLVCHV